MRNVLEYYKDQIIFNDLCKDKRIMALYRMLALDPTDKSTAYELDQLIKNHLNTRMRQLRGDCFYPPSFLNSDADSLVLGIDDSGRKVAVPLSECERHVACFGGTGNGKTTVAKQITCQLKNKGRLIILDFKKDSRNLLPFIPNTAVLMFREKNPNWKLNPLEIWPNIAPKQFYMAFISNMAASFYLGDGSINLIYQAMIQLHQNNEVITLHEVRDEIKNMRTKQRSSQWQESSVRALNAVIDPLEELLDCKRGHPLWNIIKKHHTILEMSELNTELKGFWGNWALNTYLMYKQANDMRKD